jgi:hypothetical protein
MVYIDLVVASLHVPDGRLGVNVGAARNAMNARLVDVVVVIVVLGFVLFLRLFERLRKSQNFLRSRIKNLVETSQVSSLAISSRLFYLSYFIVTN